MTNGFHINNTRLIIPAPGKVMLETKTKQESPYQSSSWQFAWDQTILWWLICMFISIFFNFFWIPLVSTWKCPLLNPNWSHEPRGLMCPYLDLLQPIRLHTPVTIWPIRCMFLSFFDLLIHESGIISYM